MLSNVKNIFKVEDLRNKVLFTFAMIALYRFGAALRAPGIDAQAVRQLREASDSQGALGFLNLFSGGAFGSFSIFALGIMPYITASIIMQVLGVVIPKLEQWQQEGATGQRKITQWTRYVAIGIATLQGAGLTFIFGQGNGSAFLGAAATAPDVVLLDPFMPRALLVIPTLVAGTALLMWIGELISQRGIGNGMYVFWPPYCLRPTTRFANCTGIRRLPSSTRTTANKIPIDTATSTMNVMVFLLCKSE